MPPPPLYSLLKRPTEETTVIECYNISFKATTLANGGKKETNSNKNEDFFEKLSNKKRHMKKADSGLETVVNNRTVTRSTAD